MLPAGKTKRPFTPFEGIQAIQECEELTTWVNDVLKSKRNKPIVDLRKAIADGITLSDLIEILAFKKVENVNNSPLSRAHKVENLKHCVDYLDDQGVDVHGITPQELADGDLKSTLHFMSNVRHHYQSSRRESADGATQPPQTSSRPESTHSYHIQEQNGFTERQENMLNSVMSSENENLSRPHSQALEYPALRTSEGHSSYHPASYHSNSPSRPPRISQNSAPPNQPSIYGQPQNWSNNKPRPLSAGNGETNVNDVVSLTVEEKLQNLLNSPNSPDKNGLTNGAFEAENGDALRPPPRPRPSHLHHQHYQGGYPADKYSHGQSHASEQTLGTRNELLNNRSSTAPPLLPPKSPMNSSKYQQNIPSSLANQMNSKGQVNPAYGGSMHNGPSNHAHGLGTPMANMKGQLPGGPNDFPAEKHLPNGLGSFGLNMHSVGYSKNHDTVSGMPGNSVQSTQAALAPPRYQPPPGYTNAHTSGSSGGITNLAYVHSPKQGPKIASQTTPIKNNSNPDVRNTNQVKSYRHETPMGNGTRPSLPYYPPPPIQPGSVPQSPQVWPKQYRESTQPRTSPMGQSSTPSQASSQSPGSPALPQTSLPPKSPHLSGQNRGNINNSVIRRSFDRRSVDGNMEQRRVSQSLSNYRQPPENQASGDPNFRGSQKISGGREQNTRGSQRSINGEERSRVDSYAPTQGSNTLERKMPVNNMMTNGHYRQQSWDNSQSIQAHHQTDLRSRSKSPSHLPPSGRERSPNRNMHTHQKETYEMNSLNRKPKETDLSKDFIDSDLPSDVAYQMSQMKIKTPSGSWQTLDQRGNNGRKSPSLLSSGSATPPLPTLSPSQTPPITPPASPGLGLRKHPPSALNNLQHRAPDVITSAAKKAKDKKQSRRASNGAGYPIRSYDGKVKRSSVGKSAPRVSHTKIYRMAKSMPSLDNGADSYDDYDLMSDTNGSTTAFSGTEDQTDGATVDQQELHMMRKELRGLETMYTEVLKLLGVDNYLTNAGSRRSISSLSSISRTGKGGRRRSHSYHHQQHRSSRDLRQINKRFARLESHVVTLARSVAHLSSEMRGHNGFYQEVEDIKHEMKRVRDMCIALRQDPAIASRSNQEFDRFRGWVPSLTNPKRVNKLTKFFGQEPPLLSIFLKKLGYERYVPNFEQEGIGMIELPYMNEERLTKIGVPMGPRLRILQEAQMCFRQENFDIYIV